MGETSSQIERQIQIERGQLGANLDELQSRVQEVTDWRAQFQKRPMVMMGVALAGGLLLASVTGKRSGHQRRYRAQLQDGAEAEHNRGTEIQKHRALEAFDNVKGALIGVAANTFQDFLGQLIPGFKTQLEKTAQEKSSPQLSRAAAQ